METRSNRLLVFAVVGLLLATLLIFAIWLFSASNPSGREYLIRFTGSVTGISKGSPVTYSGVPAGSVTAVRLATNDPTTVLVTVRLHPDVPILRGVEASISRSFISGDSTLSLDGARKGAPPIIAAAGERVPVIPAKKGGLLGSGGDPMSLIEKISRSVDNVSGNLDAEGQERVRARLAHLAEESTRWSSNVARISDGLTGTSGKLTKLGTSIARTGEGADRLRAMIEVQRGSGLRSVSERLRNSRGAAEAFGAKVEAARPTIGTIKVQQEALTARLRSIRSKTRRVRERVEGIDREGLQLFGTSKLPDYRRMDRAAKRPASRSATDNEDADHTR